MQRPQESCRTVLALAVRVRRARPDRPRPLIERAGVERSAKRERAAAGGGSGARPDACEAGGEQGDARRLEPGGLNHQSVIGLLVAVPAYEISYYRNSPV